MPPVATSSPRLSSFIGGAWVESTGDSWIDSVNPSNHKDIVAKVPAGTPADVAAAVNSARGALESWKKLSGPARADHLHKWAGVIAERQESIAQAVSRE